MIVTMESYVKPLQWQFDYQSLLFPLLLAILKNIYFLLRFFFGNFQTIWNPWFFDIFLNLILFSLITAHFPITEMSKSVCFSPFSCVAVLQIHTVFSGHIFTFPSRFSSVQCDKNYTVWKKTPNLRGAVVIEQKNTRWSQSQWSVLSEKKIEIEGIF